MHIDFIQGFVSQNLRRTATYHDSTPASHELPVLPYSSLCLARTTVPVGSYRRALGWRESVSQSSPSQSRVKRAVVVVVTTFIVSHEHELLSSPARVNKMIEGEGPGTETFVDV